MRPCCSQATLSATRRMSGPKGRYRAAPNAIADLQAIFRRGVEGAGELPNDGEQRLEQMSNRLTESFRGVLHAAIETAESAIPSGRFCEFAGDKTDAR